jgi:hypothetical protein
MGLRRPVLLLVALIAVIAGCTPDRPPPGRVLKGEVESERLVEVAAPEALALLPWPDHPVEPEIEAALERSLGRRGIGVAPGAAYRLRYRYAGVPTSFDDPELGIGVAGTSGSSDVGVGIAFPILDLFEDRPGPAGTSFRLELVVEGPDGRMVWRGRAAGLARALSTAAIARPLVPVLLDRLGADTPRRAFIR